MAAILPSMPRKRPGAWNQGDSRVFIHTHTHIEQLASRQPPNVPSKDNCISCHTFAVPFPCCGWLLLMLDAIADGSPLSHRLTALGWFCMVCICNQIHLLAVTAKLGEIVCVISNHGWFVQLFQPLLSWTWSPLLDRHEMRRWMWESKVMKFMFMFHCVPGKILIWYNGIILNVQLP